MSTFDNASYEQLREWFIERHPEYTNSDLKPETLLRLLLWTEIELETTKQALEECEGEC
jgi:hypothetical protein